MNSAAIAVNVTASIGLTLNRNAAMSRVAAAARTTPIATPVTATS